MAKNTASRTQGAKLLMERVEIMAVARGAKKTGNTKCETNILQSRKVGEVGMSMYGESKYAGEKNYLFDEIRRFIEEGHPVEELIRIVADAIEYSN